MSAGVIVFAVAAAWIGYVIAGYPLLLGLAARWSGTPIRKQAGLRKTVSVVVAVRNGAPWLRQKLESIFSLSYPRELMEVLVVSDGSDDGTDGIAGEFAARGVRLMRVPAGGKPAALNAGIPEARHEIVLLTDVRQEIEPGSLERMVACFADDRVGVVSGELLIREGETSAERNIGLYWRYESWIRNQLSALDSMLGATGPFYAIRRELCVRIPPDVLLDDVYLPLAAFFRGYRLIVEPEARAVDYPTSLETEFGRKVRTLAGNYQILWHYPQLLGPGNRLWWHYVSYKLGRLTLPFALVALAASSFQLPSPWLAWAIGAQGAFYALAALDGVMPEAIPLKKISSPARTFLVLMAASAAALQIFFVSPRKLWKPTRTRSSGAAPRQGKT